MTNERFPLNRIDPYHSSRAATYLNFAAHFRINPTTAYITATDAIDDDSNTRDIFDAPIPTNPTMMLLALANESFQSDDDFDDFLHELRHMLELCDSDDHCADDTD